MTSRLKRDWSQNKIGVMLLGPPGSGKGTQARLIIKKLALYHIETGTVIKKKIKSGSMEPDIIVARRDYEAGHWVDTKIFVRWILEDINIGFELGQGVILDGSPRTLHEAEAEVGVLNKLYAPDNVFAINLVLSDAEAVERAAKRLICNICQTPYIEGAERRVGQRCDSLGCTGVLVKKKLDTPELTVRRLKEHRDRTIEAIDYLRRASQLIEINGSLSPAEVNISIMKSLGYGSAQ